MICSVVIRRKEKPGENAARAVAQHGGRRGVADETEVSIGQAPAIVVPRHMTFQQGLLMAVTTAVLSSLGTSGGITVFSGSTPADVQAEVQELRSGMKQLSTKLGEIYTIVDRAHPRTGLAGDKP